jgi:hypothetical protein
MSEEPKQSEEKAARPLQALAPSGMGPACRHPQMTRNLKWNRDKIGDASFPGLRFQLLG